MLQRLSVMHRPRHGGPGEHLVGDIGIYEDDIDKPLFSGKRSLFHLFQYLMTVITMIMIIVMMMLIFNLRKR